MRFSLLIILNLIWVAALSQEMEAKKEGPIIKWDSVSFDFGDIARGETVEHTFTLTNEGTKPLIITAVQVTCGCTTPKGWPRNPIASGERAEIVIAFDSTGKFGRQNKVVTVISNAENKESRQLMFTANILDQKDVN